MPKVTVTKRIRSKDWLALREQGATLWHKMIRQQLLIEFDESELVRDNVGPWWDNFPVSEMDEILKGRWCDIHESPKRYIMHFELKSDMLAFKLKFA